MTHNRRMRDLSSLNKKKLCKPSFPKTPGVNPVLTMGIQMVSKGVKRMHRCSCGSKSFVKETSVCSKCKAPVYA